jgi:hypothetical protein
MKRALFPALLFLATTRMASAQEFTAHEPNYSGKTAWPNLTGHEYFVREQWPKARLLVWAQPGQNGGGALGGTGGSGRGAKKNPPGSLDPAEPANWLEGGKPASAAPDGNTDVLVPAADKEYTVNLEAARHITVGAKASVVAPKVTGNLWIKAGGRFYSTGRSIKIVGDKHTFIRNDNRAPGEDVPDGVPTKKAFWALSIGYDILVQKKKEASVEFLGVVWAGDELVAWEGMTIVGVDSILRPGRPSTQVIGPEAALILTSGSYFGKEGCGGGPVDIHVQGRVLAGTPERPLTKDATLGISCPWTYTDHRGDHAHGVYGLLIEPKAELSVHSTDPSKARLILKWNEGGSPAALKEKVNLTLLGKLNLNGVLFDQVAKGGIKLPDPAARSAWKNVYFGEQNEGKPEELFTAFKEATPKLESQGAGFIKRNP